ncbi:MAG: MOSC domain-containing protein [Planctomycetota bacterium]
MKSPALPQSADPIPPQASARLLSIQIGRVREVEAEATSRRESWTTAFWKGSVSRPLPLRTLGLEGDQQADQKHHGGIDKAVCVYSGDHFGTWRSELVDLLPSAESFSAGAFGENFTITGWTEDDVCIGDRWRVGEALVEVSQPRQPCWKLASRWGIVDLPKCVIRNGATGWYLRVIAEGLVGPSDTIELCQRVAPNWTVRRANEVMYHSRKDRELTRQLASLEVLSAAWRDDLEKRLR